MKAHSVKVLITVATAALVSSAVDSAEAQESKPNKAKKGEKPIQCFGVSLRGKNECGSFHPDKSQRHGCHAKAKCDFDGYEWVMLPAAECKAKGGKKQAFDNPKKVCPEAASSKKKEG